MNKEKFKKIAFFLLKRLLIYSALIISIPLLLGYIFMEKMLLPEVKTTARNGNTVIFSNNFELDAFFHPPQPGKDVILYNHGNAETLKSIMPLLNEFIRQGYGVMAYDYAGYGFSQGKASEKQLYSDAGSVYEFLTCQQKISPQNIIVMGFSVGSGAGCFIAERHPEIKALVLLAPFASAIEVVLPFALPGNRFNNKKRLQKSNVPLLIYHGSADRVIPLRNSRTLLQSAAGRKKLITVKNADHNNIFDFTGAGFFRSLADFTGSAPENTNMPHYYQLAVPPQEVR